MLNVVYFQNAVGAIYVAERYVQIQYHPGPRKVEELRALLWHLTRALARQGTGKVLIDQRRMHTFTPQEQAWVLGEWLPSAIKDGGYRFGAILQPQDVFARLATMMMATQAKGMSVLYRHFTDEGSAKAWLAAA
jgi:hypothetical protein